MTSPPRLIPNFNMDAPWTDPMSQEEQEGLAQTALLSGSGDSDRAVTSLMQRFAGLYVANLNGGRG